MAGSAVADAAGRYELTRIAHAKTPWEQTLGSVVTLAAGRLWDAPVLARSCNRARPGDCCFFLSKHRTSSILSRSRTSARTECSAKHVTSLGDRQSAPAEACRSSLSETKWRASWAISVSTNWQRKSRLRRVADDLFDGPSEWALEPPRRQWLRATERLPGGDFPARRSRWRHRPLRPICAPG